MSLLDIATSRPRRRSFASLTSHHGDPLVIPFIFSSVSTRLRVGYTRFTSYPNKGQAGHQGPVSEENKIRRLRCPRASRQYWHLASSHSLQHVQKRQKKNSLLSTLSRFQQSRHTPANTSNNQWGLPHAASAFSAPLGRGCAPKPCKTGLNLAFSEYFGLNGFLSNEGGRKPCAISCCACRQAHLLRPVRRQNPNPFKQNRGSINSAITNVMSFREPMSVSRRMTKNRVSWRMAQSFHPASRACHRMMTTAVHPAAAVLLERRAHRADHRLSKTGTVRGAFSAICALSSKMEASIC